MRKYKFLVLSLFIVAAGALSAFSSDFNLNTILRDGPNILALRSGTNAKELRIYNTDSGANDEFLSIGAINNTNVYTFESEATGTGTIRPFALMGGNVGIGITPVTHKLHVAGATSILKLESTSVNSQINLRNSTSTTGFIEYSGTDILLWANNAILVVGDGASENVMIGANTAPSAKLHVDQDSATGVKPVLKLDQADIDDTFIDFIGTSATDGTRSISSSTATAAAKFGAIRVEINGVTKWVRVWDAEN